MNVDYSASPVEQIKQINQIKNVVQSKKTIDELQEEIAYIDLPVDESKKHADFDSKPALYSKNFNIPIEKVEKFYPIAIAMFNNKVHKSIVVDFLNQIYEVNKDDADTIASMIEFDAKKINEVKKYSKDEKIWNVSDSIAREHKIICMKESRKLFKYNDGVYESATVEIEAEALLAKCGKDAYATHFVKQDLQKCLHRIEYTTSVPESEFDKNDKIIVVKNGLLNIETGELKPHTPDEIYTSKMDIEFKRDAIKNNGFKIFMEFLYTTFKGVEWEIEIIQELFGYCLSNETFVQAFFIFLGDGGNGKGVLLNILTGLIGKNNTSNIPLKDICGNDKFTLAGLYGKKLNVCGDIGKDMIKASENVKKLSGRDGINAQFKFGQPFTYNFFGKLIFAGNAMPEFDDGTSAIFDRLNIIDFPNKFRNTGGENKDLEKLCTTPEALSGILIWAVEGYQRLKANGKFSHHKTNKQKMDFVANKINPINAFVVSCVDNLEGNFVPKDAIYTSYKIFARMNNLPSYTKTIFFQDFVIMCNQNNIELIETQRTIKVNGEKEKPRGYIDIKVFVK
jgi:putative DNA primase/helicase